MALRNPCFKDQKLVSFEEEQTVGEKKRRGRGRRRRGRRRIQAKIKPKRYGTLIFGMETKLKYGFMEF